VIRDGALAQPSRSEGYIYYTARNTLLFNPQPYGQQGTVDLVISYERWIAP